MNKDISAAKPFFEFEIPETHSEYFPEQLNARLSFFLTEQTLNWKSKRKGETFHDWLDGRLIAFDVAVKGGGCEYYQEAHIDVRMHEVRPLPGSERFGFRIHCSLSYNFPLDFSVYQNFSWTVYDEPTNWFTRMKGLVVLALEQLEDDYLADIAK